MTNFFHSQKQHILKLLEDCELPSKDLRVDLSEDKLANFLGCGDAKNPAGVIGLEVHSPFGLLGSLAISPHARHSGNARELVEAIEQLARHRGQMVG